jgi:hypothetical protein
LNLSSEKLKSEKQSTDAILDTSMTSQAYISSLCFQIQLVPLHIGQSHPGRVKVADGGLELGAVPRGWKAQGGAGFRRCRTRRSRVAARTSWPGALCQRKSALECSQKRSSVLSVCQRSVLSILAARPSLAVATPRNARTQGCSIGMRQQRRRRRGELVMQVGTN